MHFIETCEVGSSLKDLMENDDILMRKMAKNIKEKFEKCCGDPVKMNKMIFILCMLDICHKFHFLYFSPTSMFGQTQGINLWGVVWCETCVVIILGIKC